MKSNTLVSCAVAAALAAAATAAHATNISLYASHQSSNLNVDVYISGSTAVTNTLNSVISDTGTGQPDICQAGTVDEYQDRGLVIGPTGNIGGAIETMWYCQAGSGSGVSTNLYLAIFKEDTAGSINGAQPLAAFALGGQPQIPLTFLNPEGAQIAGGTCANYAKNTTDAGGGTDAGCTAGDFLWSVVPTGGVADVEANLLRTIPGGGELTSAQIDSLSGSPGLDVVWGLGVTKNLYYALQSAEGLADGSVKSGCATADNDSPACAPSFSKEQVASILDGDVTSWTQLGLTNPSGENNIYICRRDVGSGTEASFEAYFLGARCSTSALSMVSQSPAGSGVVQLRVVEEASTGNILNCMEAFDLGGVAITPYNGDYGSSYSPFTPAGGQWAVGILSSELTKTQITSYDNSTDTEGTTTGTTRMVAIDGVLPTIENVSNGYDPYWGTDVWYTIKAGETDAPSGNPLAVFQHIQANIGHPVPTAAADLTYENVWGDGGDMSPSKLFLTANEFTTFPVSASTLEATPVNLFTKASTGAVNNCSTPVVYTGVAGAVSAPDTELGSGNVNQ